MEGGEIGQDALLKAFHEGKGTIRGTRDGLEKLGIHVSVGTVHRMLKGLDQKPPSSSHCSHFLMHFSHHIQSLIVIMYIFD